MRARHLLIILALIPIALAFPEDLPWKYPARWRLIYEINTQPLTDEYNVWVTITVPEQYYTGLITWMQNHAFCPQNNGLDPRQFWPHPWYVSDYNTAYYHFAWDYSVQEFYEYNITTTCQISLPKTFSVLIRELQGGIDFKSYKHYILLYFPALHASWWWNGLGAVGDIKYTPGSQKLYRATFRFPITLEKEDWLLVFEGETSPYNVKRYARFTFTDSTTADISIKPEGVWENLIPRMTRESYHTPSEVTSLAIIFEETGRYARTYLHDIIVLYPKLIQDLYGT